MNINKQKMNKTQKKHIFELFVEIKLRMHILFVIRQQVSLLRLRLSIYRLKNILLVKNCILLR